MYLQAYLSMKEDKMLSAIVYGTVIGNEPSER